MEKNISTLIFDCDTFKAFVDCPNYNKITLSENYLYQEFAYSGESKESDDDMMPWEVIEESGKAYFYAGSFSYASIDNRDAGDYNFWYLDIHFQGAKNCARLTFNNLKKAESALLAVIEWHKEFISKNQ